MKNPLGAVVIALLSVAVAACSRGAVRVSVATVDRGPVRLSVANTRAGTINACRRAKLAPATGGQIARLHVRKGDAVRENQVLVELWNDDLRAQVRVARNDATAAQARADDACTTAAFARREAERYARMRAQQLIAEDLAERSLAQADSAAAACRAARESMRVAEARIAAAEAALERTRLRAPFAGTVAEINGELGEFVTPSPVGIPTLPTIDLIDSSCLYVSAPIDEVDAPSVRTGMPARISLDAFQRQSYAGRVRRVAPYVLEVEKQARTVEVEIEIDSRDGRENLLPGYSADVEIVIATRADTLRVPTAAIVEGRYVLIVDERGRVARREIRTGIGNWEFTEVTSGLREGERVITSIDRPGVVVGAEVEIES
ncbi:MAG: efflux RND transporter periplasmic adaptor subunit [Steroidobacteraceae bacterium]|nr:efflux RND transporter periplasmic adaptor subunit [Steroidobacteraceae bacterium]MDW8259316.1 efflux RND transporter periplasmic adaptor subunit [Gammaproteobacteria bacterium]